jgi:hypothetical protein
MQNQTRYTESGIKAGAAFLARMLPFITEGMSLEQAGKAVLARDEQLMDAASA